MISAFHAAEVAARTAARQHFRKIGITPITPAGVDDAGIRRLPLAVPNVDPGESKRSGRRQSTGRS
jgi:hypothetical protein